MIRFIYDKIYFYNNFDEYNNIKENNINKYYLL